MQVKGNFQEAFDISDAFGSAIEHVKRVPAVAFVGGLLTMCTDYSSNSLDVPDLSAGLEDPTLLITALVSGVFLLVSIVQFFLAPFVEAGFILAQRQIVDDRDPQPSILFTGRHYYARLLGWNFCWLVALLIAILPVVGAALWLVQVDGSSMETLGEDPLESLMVLFAAIGLWMLVFLPILGFVWLGLSLTSRIVVCEDRPLFEAAKASWQLTSGHRLALVPFAIVGFLFRLGGSLVGILLCCVGIFVVYPFAIAVRDLAWTRAYVWYVHGDSTQRTADMAEVFR